ncbi:MAG TPA: hypothetical protein VIV65_01780, partial [Gemmatimonadaceae bacterium]
MAESFDVTHDKPLDSARDKSVGSARSVWRTTLKSRIFVAAAGLLLWSTAIEARLVYLQVYRHTDLLARAERQQLRTIA